MSTYSVLKDQLDEVRRSLPELEGVLVASDEGLPIAHSVGNRDANRMAAMATAAQSLGNRVGDGLSIGSVSDIRISGDQGDVFIYSGGKTVVALIGTKEGNAGLLHLEGGAMARRVNTLMARNVVVT